MPKFKYSFYGEEANWEEHLYHTSLPVHNGIVEVDAHDDLTIDALLHRGWEPIEEDAPVQAKKAAKPAATE